ncbi:unnamed protein product [Closterium sp. Naga37s-1]|nr:unnamed protein product [Closterium sp. Naga37s-1]
MATLHDDNDAATPSAGHLYNPYADLYPNLDARSIQGIYRLPDAPEFLFTEEAAVQRRSFGDNLTFFTGCGYLGGALFGGIRGTAEGFRSWEAGDSAKLRANRVLNAAGSRGRSAGNALGIVGLLYSGIEGAAYHYRGGVDDPWNAVVAGLGTGALYKAAAGPRTAAIAGAVGGIAAAALTASRHVVKRYFHPAPSFVDKTLLLSPHQISGSGGTGVRAHVEAELVSNQGLCRAY